MATVGPGATQDLYTDVKPLLEGANEFEYITIRNILSDDFAIRVAQDIPINSPFNIGKDPTGRTAQTTMTERDAAQTYGLTLKNPDFVGKQHIFNDTVIKAGETVNLKGNEAQVAVRQIVNEAIQRSPKRRLMADPTLRKEFEEQIIVGRGSIQELMDNQFKTQSSQIDEALRKSNEATDDPEPGTGVNYAPDQSERRKPGRPAKS